MKSLKVFAAFMLMLVAVPVFAQKNVSNTVRYNDFSFSFHPALATYVNITQYLIEPADVFPLQGLSGTEEGIRK